MHLTGYRRANAQRTDEQDRYQAKKLNWDENVQYSIRQRKFALAKYKVKFQRRKQEVSQEESSTENLEDMSSQ